MRALLAAYALLAASLVLGCASHGCPKPGSPPAAKAEWEGWVAGKKKLALRPGASIAIKRDVHNVVVDVPAARFADAFHQVLRDSKRRFGLIQINRMAKNLDQPFTKGERFQGRYSLEGALEQKLDEAQRRSLEESLEDPATQAEICTIENDMMSDYGILTDLTITDAEFRFSYQYLAGSPIAGSSTFTVTRLDDGHSTVSQIFEYQEQSQAFAVFFSNVGLKLHNQVVWSQVTQALTIVEGHVVSSDIPDAYRNP